MYRQKISNGSQCVGKIYNFLLFCVTLSAPVFFKPLIFCFNLYLPPGVGISSMCTHTCTHMHTHVHTHCPFTVKQHVKSFHIFFFFMAVIDLLHNLLISISKVYLYLRLCPKQRLLAAVAAVKPPSRFKTNKLQAVRGPVHTHKRAHCTQYSSLSCSSLHRQ